MRFRTKILAALTTVGVLPLALLGWLSFTVNRDELEASASAAQQLVATEAARAAEKSIARGVEGLRLSLSLLPLDALTADEMTAALHIPYGQLQSIDAIALLDQEGRLDGPLVAESRPGGPRKTFEAEDLRRFLAAAPVGLAAQAGTALGAPYRGRGGETHVAVAVRVSRPGSRIRVVAAQFSFDELKQILREAARPPALAFLAGGDGRLLAEAGVAPGGEARFADLVTAAAGKNASLSRVVDGWLATATPVGGLGWVTGVATPIEAAWGPALRVRRYTLFWVAAALILTVALGMTLSAGLTGPVGRLKRFAKSLQEGRYGERLDLGTSDELGELAQAFSHVASEVQRRDDEIRRFNAELQERVEARTTELRMAQDQILRTRRLAAIGSLGAGLAHEINNPLMALGGYLAILDRSAAPEQQVTVRKAQEQMKRVARIVENLLQFSNQERTVQGRRFTLSAPVRAVLERYAARIENGHIELATDLDRADREAEGDPIQIEHAVEHLVRNAIQAMPTGGRLHVCVADVGGDSLKLTVSDTGKGISPAIRDRIFDPFFSTRAGSGEKGEGLGLSITHSIVEAHHGKIVVDSVEGHGSTFTVVLPAASAAVHLT